MAANTQDNDFSIPNLGDDDIPNFETFDDLLRLTINFVKEQRIKRVQVACCIYMLTQANVTIPTSVKEIIKATKLPEREVNGIIIYLMEQKSLIEFQGDLDLEASFYITSKGIAELEFEIDAMLR